MFNEITFYPILGIPVIVYGGAFTFLCFLSTASIPILNGKGITKIPVKWHIWMARISLVLGAIHGALGLLAYINL